MTKKEVDIYFIQNERDIIDDVYRNMPKSYTVNKENIIGYIYELCVEKCSKIQDIEYFIKIAASNIYKWKNSQFNKENLVRSKENVFSYTYIKEEDEYDYLTAQLMEYALAKYKLNATPSEKVFYDIYVEQNKRTIKDVMNYTNVSYRGARALIEEFKNKIKKYSYEG